MNLFHQSYINPVLLIILLMNCGFFVVTSISIITAKIVYDILSLKAGENTYTLVRIMLLIGLFFSLLVGLLLVFLINYINRQIGATETVVTVTEITEEFDESEKENLFAENKAPESLKHLSEENCERGRKKRSRI